MARTTVAILVGLVLVGCSQGNSKSDTPPSRPTLKAVELRSRIYLARIEDHLTISPDGFVRSERTTGGPGDDQRREVRQGRLTSGQMDGLAVRFARWESITPRHWGGVPDGGELTIRCGGIVLSGGSDAPQNVHDIAAALAEIASTFPVVDAHD